MPELKQREDELRVILSRVDQKIEKFKLLQEKIASKKKDLSHRVIGAGLEHVPVLVKPELGSEENLEQELEDHVLELKKLKNYVLKKLEKVVKEEELFKELEKKFKGKIKISKHGKEDFEVTYSDEETKQALSEIKKSRENVSEIKKIIEK